MRYTLKLMMIFAQLSDCTENPCIVPFKWMNYVVCDLHLDMAVIKQKESLDPAHDR